MLVSLDHSTRPVLLKFLSIFPTKIGRRLVERCSCCLKTTFSVKLRQISVGCWLVDGGIQELSTIVTKEGGKIQKYSHRQECFCFPSGAANTVITLPSLRSLTVKVALKTIYTQIRPLHIIISTLLKYQLVSYVKYVKNMCREKYHTKYPTKISFSWTVVFSVQERSELRFF